MKKVLLIAAFVMTVLTPLCVFSISTNGEEKNFTNVVFFAYFNGTDEEEEEDVKYFEDKTEEFIGYYDTNNNSLKNYLKEISYDQFNVQNIFPQIKNNIIEPIKIPINIEDAYTINKDESILDEIIKKYTSINGVKLDYREEGIIDNVTVIIKWRDGYTTNSNSSFVSHKSDYSGTKLISGKRVVTYNIVDTKSIEYNKAGVIAHEFLHSIGYPDLYRNTISDDPVSLWDIMGSVSQGMAYPLAYLRSYFSNWLTIDTITESTNNLRLDVQYNKNGNQAYILKSPLNDYEFFVVEYRKKNYLNSDSVFDLNIGRSGVIVYRIDTTVERLSNKFNNQTGVYVFRPVGKSVYLASLAKPNLMSVTENDRIDTIGSSDMNAKITDGALTFSDGTNSGIVIKNVSEAGGDYMTLDVEIPSRDQFDLWKNTNLPDLSNNTNRYVEVVNYKNKIYSLSYGVISKKLYTQVLENDNWKNLGSLNIDAYQEIKTLIFNDELYLVLKGTNLSVYKLKNDAWIEVAKTTKDGNYFGAINFNGKIYIALTENNITNLYVLDNNEIKFVEEICRQTTALSSLVKLGVINNTLYISVMSTDGAYLYKYANDIVTQIDPEIGYGHGSYDLISLNNKLYFILESGSSIEGKINEHLAIRSYDGNKFETINSAFNLLDVKGVVNQGNLYILGRNETNLYVFSFSEANKMFNLEGSSVDSGTSYYNTSLTSLNDKIFVGIGRDEFIGKVKTRTVSNKLLSLSITPPKKTKYYVGEAFDKTGLVVNATYVEETKEIKDYEIVDFNTTNPGSYEATIWYSGLSVPFKYEVIKKEQTTTTTTTKPTTTTTKLSKKPLKSISLNKTNLTLNIGASEKLFVSYNPIDTTDNKKVIWTSSNNNIVTVVDGKVVAKNKGSAIIKATVGNKTIQATVKVLPFNIALATSSIANQTFTGSNINALPVVKYKNVVLKKDVDYKLTYQNNKYPGTATIVITGINNYTGTKKISFKIVFEKPTLKFVASSPTKIKLSWTKVKGAIGYTVFKYDAKTKKYVAIRNLNTLSYVVPNLKSGANYAFCVKAYYYKNGQRVHSNVSNVIKESTLPDTPKISKVVKNKKALVVNWSKVNGATGYVVYRSTNKDSGYVKVATTTALSYKDSKNLVKKKKYYYKIRAYKNVYGKTIFSGLSIPKYKIYK